MKTDLYTKVVLTVIAFCLVINLVKETVDVTPAHARESITQVDIVAISGKKIPQGLIKPTLPVRIYR